MWRKKKLDIYNKKMFEQIEHTQQTNPNQQQQIQQQYLVFKLNQNVQVLKTPHLIQFVNRQGQQWRLKNNNGNNASKAILDKQQYSVGFSFPNVTQVIYPGQTARIDSGWQIQKIPDKCMATTAPHKGLMDSNLISIPQYFMRDGAGIVQTLLNNNDYPIQITLKQDGNVGLFALDRKTLRQDLQLDVDRLLNTMLGTAAQILPFFL